MDLGTLTTVLCTVSHRTWPLVAAAVLLGTALIDVSATEAETVPPGSTDPLAAAVPAADPNCGYGTGGPLDTGLCWIDMAGFTSGAVRVITLPGGLTLSFTLTVSGQSLPARAFPTHTNNGFFG